MDELASYVEKLSEEARLLASGDGAAYDVARRMWILGLEGMTNEVLTDVARPIWLIWGALTDWFDGPSGREAGAEEAASSEMRRAAAEWLLVAGDPATRTRYLNHWLYEECGYERNADDRNE